MHASPCAAEVNAQVPALELPMKTHRAPGPQLRFAKQGIPIVGTCRHSAGLPPQTGLYAGILPPLVYAVLGTSRTLAVGPVFVTAIMVAQALAHVPHGSIYVASALLLALLGGIVYLYFRVDIRPSLERAGHWPALGFFDIKEHFISIGAALLPAYWLCWRRPRTEEPYRLRAALTAIQSNFAGGASENLVHDGRFVISISITGKSQGVFAGKLPSPADLDGDDDVDGIDLAMLLAAWGACATDDCLADLDASSNVNGADVAMLLNCWNPM